MRRALVLALALALALSGCGDGGSGPDRPKTAELRAVSWEKVEVGSDDLTLRFEDRCGS